MATHPGVEPSCAPVAEGDMLAVVFVETPQNDAEFDLEVRLQPAGFRVSANEPPTNTVDCYTQVCPSTTSCGQHRRQD